MSSPIGVPSFSIIIPCTESSSAIPSSTSEQNIPFDSTPLNLPFLILTPPAKVEP